MAIIDELLVKIAADTKDLQKGLKKATDVTDKSSKKMAASTRIATAGFNKLKFGAIGASAAITAMGVGLVNEVDKIQKLGVRLGESTDNLSRMQFVAEQSGVSFETLTMSFQRMQRRVAEAANGFGEAKDALNELGINAEELNQLTVTEQFMEITKAMEGVGNTADRTRLAMKLFDSEGVALTQIMDQGADAVRRLANETPNVITQADADRVAQFNDNINLLKNTLKSGLLPVVTTLASAINALFGTSDTTRLQKFKVELDEINRKISEISTGEKTTSFFGMAKRVRKDNEELKNELLNRRNQIKSEIDLLNSKVNSDKKGINDLGIKAQESAKNIETSMVESTNVWSDRFTDAILNAKSGMQGLSDFSVQVASEIAKNMFTKKISEPLINYGSESLGNIFSGGSVQATTQSAMSTQSIQPRVQGGGISVNQNFTITSGTELNEIDKKINEKIPLIVETSKAGVLQGIQSSGKLTNNLRGR